MKVPKVHHQQQMSEAFEMSAFLALSGGFQDAYTYFGRGGVFSNAQTGNIVLLSSYIMEGKWGRISYYLLPLLAFTVGAVITDLIEEKMHQSRKIHWRQLVLLVEIALLFLVGLMPESWNQAATCLVSLACAMQVQGFRTVHGRNYASTMCINSLRAGAVSLAAFIRDRDVKHLRRSISYYLIIVLFALGAGLGSYFTIHMGLKAIWGSCAMLLVSFLLMFITDEKYIL